MSVFPSHADPAITAAVTDRARVAHSSNLDDPLVRMLGAVPALTLTGLTTPGQTAVLSGAGPTPGPPVSEYPTASDISEIGDQWFEIIHVLPRRIDLGNIISVVTVDMEIYNAFKYEGHYLQAFTNNAGPGTSIIDLPGLPYLIPAQRSLPLTLQVTQDGPSVINTTLDFDVDEPYTLSVPITGTRIVVFPFEPEAPLVEKLLFLTDVIEHLDGTEQRIALRLAPRQVFEMLLRREDGPEKQRVDFLLFDWQSRVFGLPIWTEPSFLTAPATSGQTSVSVDDTTLGDFRVGGLAFVFTDESTFDAVEIASISATVINFVTPLLNDHASGTRVLPMRTAVTSEPAKESKYAKNLVDYQLNMRVVDNDVSLASTSGWPTYSGKVLLSDPNAIEDTLDGSIERRILVFDGDTGVFSQSSTWDRARHGSYKTFIVTSRSALWSVRRLLHALAGQQVSFHLPTFTKDVSLATTYSSGGSALTIYNVGYARYARERTPKSDIRVVLNDGTVYSRTITASAEIDEDTEQITLSSSIPQTIAPGDVDRIEFVEKVRITSDEISIEHADANGTARIGFPVKVVLE